MMTSLKLVLQFAIASIAIAETAPDQRELMAQASIPSTGANSEPSAQEQGTPAQEPSRDVAAGEARGNDQKQEATENEKSETSVKTDKSEMYVKTDSPWSTEIVATLVTVLGVLFLLFGLGLSFATYMVSKKEEKTQEKAASAPQASDTAEKKFGHVVSDASTAASDAPALGQV